MSQLTLSLLGAPRLEVDGHPLSVDTRKATALLIYLAVTNEIHRRDALCALLWPESNQKRAYTSLRRTLSSLNKALNGRWLVADQTTLALNKRDPSKQERDNEDLQQTVTFFLDVDEFERLISTWVEHNHPENQLCDRCLADLAQAVSLYRDDFLTGFSLKDAADFDHWQSVQVEALRREMLEALEKLVQAHSARREYGQAILHAQRWLAMEPLHEPAHGALMQLYAWSGDRAAALQQYEECVRLLDEELGVPPLEETTALFEEIQANRSAPHTRLLSLDAQAVHNDVGVQEIESPIPSETATPKRLDPHKVLARLEPLPDQKLFGVETARTRLEAVIEPQDRPWLIAIDGIGGIGKTTLADTLVRRFVESERFADIGWVSAKQEEFLANVGIQETGRPALDAGTLTDSLLEQLDERSHLAASSQEKQAALLRLVKEHPYFIVVDNLESVVDYEALVPYLRQLANPSKFLITSRLTLQAHTDIYCYSLTELNEADTLAFLRHESKTRGIARLADASDEQYQTIYQVVGGNPLALKLVMGQVRFLALSQVLANLVEAQGKRIDQLYTYIYWQAWQMLDNTGRQLFVTMPTIPNGNFEQLIAISELDPDDVQIALERLIALSLVQVRGDLDEPRYQLHRLTETFLMNEVLKWSVQP
ncbi:hypothetical protein KFU94_33240 [Chloroflexi bacterium TSY]|nr:hypothetical protein [Chloroflexi bacterium TSY]